MPTSRAMDSAVTRLSPVTIEDADAGLLAQRDAVADFDACGILDDDHANETEFLLDGFVRVPVNEHRVARMLRTVVVAQRTADFLDPPRQPDSICAFGRAPDGHSPNQASPRDRRRAASLRSSFALNFGVASFHTIIVSLQNAQIFTTSKRGNVETSNLR